MPGSLYFNPRSPCGERRPAPRCPHQRPSISIHAPRVGSDSIAALIFHLDGNISIHAPRVGSDQIVASRWLLPIHFNPRSPCGERPGMSDLFYYSFNFNPRSPCGERPLTRISDGFSIQFQSTLPVWGATLWYWNCFRRDGISIHAPRVGSDCKIPSTILTPTYFNPRSPCGERPKRKPDYYPCGIFQSTLPVWGATSC